MSRDLRSKGYKLEIRKTTKRAWRRTLDLQLHLAGETSPPVAAHKIVPEGSNAAPNKGQVSQTGITHIRHSRELQNLVAANSDSEVYVSEDQGSKGCKGDTVGGRLNSVGLTASLIVKAAPPR